MNRLPRTCTEVLPNGEHRAGIPLGALRDRAAYVLLGEPGAGKTTCFETEAEAHGATSVSARDFIALPPEREWQSKPIYIDGLDEIRASYGTDSTPLDAIRRKLIDIGAQSFRLSCREADWLASDHDLLSRVARERVAVLHLEPLTDEQIRALLRDVHRVPSPDAFLTEANDRGLLPLLRNPQNLAMLAKAVKDGWPDTLSETFELACRQLALEPNRAHRDAKRAAPVSVDAVLGAAGELCAIQLLAGVAGFASDLDSADSAYPDLNEIGFEIKPVHRRALDSRLFSASSHCERHAPAHRRIAEFLAARAIASRIAHEALPLGRVLAVLRAEDGGVVSDLRGLHAWLAVHCATGRAQFVDADALGVVLYGDARSFPPEQKGHLLAALGREAQRYPWFRSDEWQSSPFGALGDQGSAPMLREILESPQRASADEALLDCALDALYHGEKLLHLAPALLDIVRDDSHWPANRTSALRAYVHIQRDAACEHLELLEEVVQGRIADDDDELIGLLLEHLYPAQLSPEQVFAHLHAPKRENLIGTYHWFWSQTLFERTTSQQMPVLADRFAVKWPSLAAGARDYLLRELASKILTGAIDAADDLSDTQRIWSWLGIGLDAHHSDHNGSNDQARIRHWLADRPKTLQALFELVFERCATSEDPVRSLIAAEQRIRDARLPVELVGWQFERAARFKQEDARNYVFNRAAQDLLHELGNTPEALEELTAVAACHPILSANVTAWLRSDIDDWRSDDQRRKRERLAEATERVRNWQTFVRRHFAAMEAGTVAPKTLHDLAMVYCGRFRETEGEQPLERIRNWFGGDESLAQCVLRGLQNTLTRKDLPTVAEIVRLAKQGRHHYIAEACHAGADAAYADRPQAVRELPEVVSERLIAFRLTHDFDKRPAWFAVLVSERAELVAQVLVAYVRAMLGARKEHIAGLYPLAFDDDYRDVARIAALDLLAAFPTRARRAQASNLEYLLVAALRHADRRHLKAMTAERIARSGMDLAQRAHWLCAGLMLDPRDYERQLVDFVHKGESRAMLVSGFFSDRVLEADGLPQLTEGALTILLRAIGRHTSPSNEHESGFVSGKGLAAGVVRTLLARLASRLTPSAFKSIESLLTDDTLGAWHDRLRHAQEAQRKGRREATYRHPSASAVAELLRNGPPAHAADLKSLLTQHLSDIARADRDGDLRGYARYWNDAPREPKHENDCRDRLLELLRERLRAQSIEVAPEGRYREESRADIRASYGGVDGFNVPIEIKRDTHRDLWTAMDEQLIAKYTCDPGADGHGIYLVFWFGRGGMPVPTDGGKPAATATELEHRLAALLSERERGLINVVVIDVSQPGGRIARSAKAVTKENTRRKSPPGAT